jgi:hypothetical protein
MFTPEERSKLRERLLEMAAQDARLGGVAVTGSASDGREDRWSDIDLAFGVKEGEEFGAVVSGWTERMYAEHGAVHHTDIQAGPWIYRVFLLANTLQVDLAFVPQGEFRATAPTFRLVSGTASEAKHWPAPPVESLMGMGWLYALHARGCLARGRRWQAEYMISAMRDTALTLACLRHELPAAYGRGMDQLPEAVRAGFEAGLVRSLEEEELARAFGVVTGLLLKEIRATDGELADRLQGVVGELPGWAIAAAAQSSD